jgi:hypothetical protein
VSDSNDRVDGWEIRDRPDGAFGVYDAHGLLAGPFGTKEEAMKAALSLPKDGPRFPRERSAGQS